MAKHSQSLVPTREVFKAGDVILNKGNYGEELFIIESGLVEVFDETGDGTKIPIAMIKSGEFLGEMAVITGKPVSATAKAITDVEALRFSKNMIDAQMKTVPSWLVAMVKGAILRVHVMNELLRRNKFVDEKLKEAIEQAEAEIREMQQEEISEDRKKAS